jgi:hypothetical protein
MSNEVKYTVTNKATGEVFPVIGMAFGDEVVEVTTSNGVIVFSNVGSQGDLLNDDYEIKEVVSGTETGAVPVETVTETSA